MSRQLKRALLVGALAVPFAELGHLVAYGVRVPSGGSHLYFPTLLQLAGGALGAALLASLAVLALARLLTGLTARSRPWSFPLLFAGLLAAQLLVFLFQEAVEARSLPHLSTISLGLLAQQPIALVAAMALRWLSARLGPATRALSTGRPAQLTLRGSLFLAPQPIPASQPLLAGGRVRACGQRAPPP
jgi:hypothetical protein